MWHCVRQRNQGFVLITFSMLLLFILSLIGIAASEFSLIEYRNALNHWNYHLAFDAAETNLKMEENNLSQSLPNCMINTMPSADLIAKPISWWQTTSCSGNFSTFQYYYVVELLDDEPCALVAGNAVTVNHYRLTFMMVSANTKAKIILQTTDNFIANKASTMCSSYHVMTLGRQSWFKF